MSDKLCEVRKALNSVADAIAFSPMDFASSSSLAWIYGVMLGWDGNSLRELQKKFRWTDATVARLKRRREAVKTALQS